MFDKAILHLDLDAFFVSVECLRNSSFIGRPLIIGGTSSRGVVSSCSYEARKFGVTSAMPMRMALRLCPDAIVLKGDMDAYSQYSKLVTDIIADEAPSYEKASIDEFYLDISGMDKYFGCYNWSTELRHKIIKESGLPISFGLSINKLVSKVGAGEAKPNGAMKVENGEEKKFLAPLAIQKIPGVGKETTKKLQYLGVKKIKTLSEVPVNLLEREFGKPGKILWQKANGIDNSPVVPYSEKKSISKERTFMQDTINILHIKNILVNMVDQLTFELRDSQRLVSCITVKIRYADFNTFTRQINIPYTANENLIIRHVKEIFDKLYERRQMIRLVGVKFSGLVHGNYQISLFDDTVEDIKLMQEVDHIRRRFGIDKIMRASSMRDLIKQEVVLAS